MTRGRLAIINKDSVYTSNEFNGDMYYEGYGESAIKYLRTVDSAESLLEAVKNFNKEDKGLPLDSFGEKVLQLGEIGIFLYKKLSHKNTQSLAGYMNGFINLLF